jgi:CRP-like cAMP-binding protein
VVYSLIRKLEIGNKLLEGDRERLGALGGATVRILPRKNLIDEDDIPATAHLVLDGFACRYKILRDGRRAILAFLLPGDFCDLHLALLGHMDHAIGTITSCTFARVPFATIEDLTVNHPRISRALWWATLWDEAIMREWLASMGQRAAGPQLAHLMCELFIRLQITGHVAANSFAFPFTQEELGDTLGISSVHVNRVLQQLREEALITLHARKLTILDFPRLLRYAGFKSSYLHLPAVRPIETSSATPPPRQPIGGQPILADWSGPAEDSASSAEP